MWLNARWSHDHVMWLHVSWSTARFSCGCMSHDCLVPPLVYVHHMTITHTILVLWRSLWQHTFPSVGSPSPCDLRPPLPGLVGLCPTATETIGQYTLATTNITTHLNDIWHEVWQDFKNLDFLRIFLQWSKGHKVNFHPKTLLTSLHGPGGMIKG